MADRTLQFPTKEDSPKTVEVNAGDDIKFTDSDGNTISAAVLIPDGKDLIAILPNGETLILQNFFAHLDDPAEIISEDGSQVVFSGDYSFDPSEGPSAFIPGSDPYGLGYEPVEFDVPGFDPAHFDFGFLDIIAASGLFLEDRARWLYDILPQEFDNPPPNIPDIPIEIVSLSLQSVPPVLLNNAPIAIDDPAAPAVFQTNANQALMTATLGSVAQDLEPNPGNPPGEHFNLAPNLNVLNSTTVPHLTINGNGDGTFDYFQFTGNIGNLVTLDIDNENFGATLFLYDLGGNLIGSNLMGPGGDPGDGLANSALLQIVLPSSGTFIAGVGGPGAMDAGGFIGGPVPMAGDVYDLNISVGGHNRPGPKDPVPEVEINHPVIPAGFPFAQDIDIEDWTFTADPNIIDSTTVRHTSITGTGDLTFDYYSFTATAGQRGIFDIDGNDFDSSLFVYDALGNLVASNDDGTPGDPGNGVMGASFIDFFFPSSGQFTVAVGTNLSSGNGGLVFTGPPPAGGNYILHASVGNHSPGGPNDPIAEVEFNNPNLNLANFATDIDTAGWNTGVVPDIQDSATVPHVTIVGGGDDTFDYFSFTATAGSQAVFDIDNENFDTQLFLYDTDGNLLASNDDSMAGADPGDVGPGASRITFDFTGFPTGTYIVGVGTNLTANGDGQIGGTAQTAGQNYRLHVSLTGHPLNAAGTDPFGEAEPNEPGLPPNYSAFSQDLDPENWNLFANPNIEMATAIPHISVNGTGDGSFDYYSFDAAPGDQVILDIDNNSFDSVLFLYDSAGNLLAFNDDNPDPGNGVMGASQIDFTIPPDPGSPPGPFTVVVGRVGSFDGGGIVVGNPPLPGDTYTLHVSSQSHAFVDPNGMEVEDNHPTTNLVATAQDVDGERWNVDPNPNILNDTTVPHLTVQGTGDGTFDYYSFAAAAGAMGVFDVDNQNFNTALYLYDAAGNLLVSNDVSMAGPDAGDGATPGASRIAFTFGPAGTYIIGVGTGAGASGNSDGFIAGTAPGPGTAYNLHLSLTGHALVPINDPVAEVEVNDPSAFPPGAIFGSLLINDFDPDGDPISVTGNTNSAFGATVNVLADGSFTYDPSGLTAPGNPIVQAGAGVVIADTFTYTITDSGGLTDTATVTINVTGVNDAPITGGDNVNPDPGDPRSTGVSITANLGATNVGNLLANDLDPDIGDTININAHTAAGTGLVTRVGNNVFYNPNGQFAALNEGDTTTDTFTYTITDGLLTSAPPAVVTVTITGVNDPPEAQDDAVGVNEDGPALMGNLFADNGSGVDSDPDSADTVGTNVPITHVNGMNAAAVIAGTAINLPSGALLTITNEVTGAFTYDPNGQFESVGLGETDTDTFTYRITDPLGAVDTATATITITGFNDQPTASNVTITPNILENTLDDTVSEDSTVLNVDVGAQAMAADEDTNDVLSFEVDTRNVANGVTGVTTTLAGFVPGDVTVTVADAANGLFDVSSAKFNNLRLGQTAVVVFEYAVRDDSGATTTPAGTNETELSATRMVTLTVEGTNDQPVVSNFVVAATQEGVLADSMGNENAVFTPPPLAGATRADLMDEDDGDTHTYELVGANGGLVLGGSGAAVVDVNSVTVSAPTGVNGAYTVSSPEFNNLAHLETLTLTFSYAARDNSGAGAGDATNEPELSDPKTVTLTIQGSNDAPDAVDDAINGTMGTASFTEDSGAMAILASILANDTDPDVNDTRGVNQFTTSAGFAGQLVAVDGVMATINTGSTTYTPASNLTSLTYNPNGQFESLAHGATTTTTFDYRIVDSAPNPFDLTDTATVTVTVTGVNDAPVLNLDANNSGGGADDGDFDSTFQVGAGAVNIGDVDASLTDIDTGDLLDSLTATLTNIQDAGMETLAATASGGADTINYVAGTGVLTITASGGSASAADFQAVLQSITYENTAAAPNTAVVRTIDVQANDGGPVNGLSNTVTANVTVVATDAMDDAYSGIIGNVGLDVSAGDGVLANDLGATTVTMVQGVSGNVGMATATTAGGSVTVLANGSFIYEPPAGSLVADSFTYEADGADTATVNLTFGADMIWFINNAGSGTNAGTFSDPFLTLGAFETVNGTGGLNPAAGQDIFLYTGSGAYTGGVTLENTQSLIGQGAAGTTLEALLGITSPTIGNIALPSINGTRPDLTSTTTGITLASGNTVRGLDVSTTGGTSITGSSVGTTLTIKDVAVTNTNGVGVNLANGALDVTFDSISSSGGTNGIVLTTTTGSFMVTGDGATANSGGIISNTVGDGNSANTAGDGIVINNATNVSLSFMRIDDPGDHGIHIVRATNFQLKNSTLDDGTGNTFANDQNDNLIFIEKLYGQNLIQDVDFTNIPEHAIKFAGDDTDDGTADELTVRRVTSTDTSLINGLNVGAFDIRPQGTANVKILFDTVTVTNDDFNEGGGLFFNTQGSATAEFTLRDSTFDHTGGFDRVGVRVSSSGTSSVTALIDNVNVIGASLVGFELRQDSSSGTSHITLQNSFVTNSVGAGTDGTAVPAQATDIGVRVFQDGNSNLRAKIDNVAVNASTRDNAFVILSQDATVPGQGNLDVIVTNNSFLEPLSDDTNTIYGLGIFVQAQNFNTIQARISGNTGTTGGGFPGFAGFGEALGMDEDVASATIQVEGTGTNVVTTLTAQNPGLTSTYPGYAPGPYFPVVEDTSGGSAATVVAAGTVTTPTLPTLPALLLAAEGIGETEAGAMEALTESQLDATVNEAIEQWVESGVTPFWESALRAVDFQISDLQGAALGDSEFFAVKIDIDAAGHGWFIDSTPEDNSEFTFNNETGTLEATAGGPAAGKIDLLSVVSHELGHILGLSDFYAPQNSGNLMYIYLETGERKLPGDDVLDLDGFLAEIAYRGAIAEAAHGHLHSNTLTLTAKDVLELDAQSVNLDNIAAAPAQSTGDAAPSNPADALVVASTAGSEEAASLEAASAAAASIADQVDDDAAVQEMAAAV